MDLENSGFSVPFHWSAGVVAITIVSLAILTGSGFVTTALLDWPNEMLWLKYLLLAIFSTTIIGVAGYCPIRLMANHEKITVNRWFGALEIPLNEVTGVIQISKSDIADSIRTFGSGGLFGFLGRFHNGRLGHYTMYATDLKNLVLICTAKKKYVFSCSEAQDFVDYIKNGR